MSGCFEYLKISVNSKLWFYNQNLIEKIAKIFKWDSVLSLYPVYFSVFYLFSIFYEQNTRWLEE